MAESDYTAEYISAAAAQGLTANYYIEIGGVTEKFSLLPVSGLANNLSGVIQSAKLSGAATDVNSPKTPLQSLLVKLVDDDSEVTGIFADKDLHEQTVNFYFSPDKDLDFSKYGLKAQFRLKELRSGDGNTYEIRCIETGELLLNRVIIGSTILSQDIDDTQTTGIFVENSDEFVGTGTKKAYVGEERIQFTGIDEDNQLTGVTRGADSTTADDHSAGEAFDLYVTITGENYIDIMLQLMVSEGGGGSYDVLDFGLGISESLIDVTAFENIRDTTGYISTPTFDLELRGDIDSFLSFMEDNYLNPAGLRFWYTDSGKISLLIIAEPTPALPPDVEKTDMVQGKMPKWSANSNRIVNKLVVKVNYNITTDKYERELVFTDDDSIARYGLKKPKKFQTRALQTANGAQTFLNTFANKYFTFYSTPAPVLDAVNLLSDSQFYDAGNTVAVNHPDLPNLGTGKRGVFGDLVQVLGKTFNIKDSVTKYEIFYSLLLNFRIGFIAPTGYVASGVHTTTVFDLNTGEGAKFAVDDVVTLWNPTWESPPVNHGQSTITDITGDQITVSPAFSVTPGERDRLRYADFDQVQESQKVFMFVAQTGGGDFGDGSKSYKIGA
jgi:hypothetical protein